MKRLVLIFVGVIMLSAWGSAQETKREKRASRARTQTELIRTLFEMRDLRFEAQIAQPLSGGTIHLSSLYNLDLIGDSVASHLPFYGVAYSVDYGGGSGGFMFEKQLADVKWETSKHGYEVTAEVRVPRDVYKMHLSFSTAGYATLSVISQNRQAMHFTGVISKRENSR